eukprot:CAMPEP_0170270560 /NCGR_PEP_ID=MMETSP0116_2-20130129/35225_1 /TAXON_ID=400756 /ORGANISM="Durinskia baltica, Strain CSIRO CS-38" /LENGTH=585 /DNA_ID=CAMNT_0010521753 /DNA_START=31 /DNA_END=1788 /DNA_ORIENTATION=-
MATAAGAARPSSSPTRGGQSPKQAPQSSPTNVSGVQPKNGPPVRFGVSDPISLQESTEADRLLSEQMSEELQAEFPAETAEGMARRQAVLREIEQMFSDWAAGIATESGQSPEEARRQGMKVTTLGSYRLGVVHPGSDIDTLCIGPPNVTREHFFDTFVPRLERHRDVSECVPIPDAYTPIVKLKMNNVCIDLLFARLATALLPGADPEEMARDDDVLRNMDEKSVRCMNGFRVADQILALVPNEETFRRTLRFVKFWARRRGIYSNVIGFFGGITWSLLVARVCQLYPYYSPSQLVNRFFMLYFQWNWSWQKPVMLCDIVEPRKEPGLAELKVWNPKTNPADRQHVMPVITPAFPAMNSTYNVTETTKRILLEEFRRGLDTMRLVEQQKADWSKVHEPHPFFEQFRHFLWLEVLVRTDEVYKKFSGWVESKLRILIMQFESVAGMQIHPNPLQYDLCGSDPDWPLGCGMFIALLFSAEAGAHPGITVDLRGPLQRFMEVINQWADKDAYAGQFKLRLRRIKRSELPEYALDPEAAQRRRTAAGPWKKRAAPGDEVAAAVAAPNGSGTSPIGDPSVKRVRVVESK